MAGAHFAHPWGRLVFAAASATLHSAAAHTALCRLAHLLAGAPTPWVSQISAEAE